MKKSNAGLDGGRDHLSFADRIAGLNKTRQEIIRPVQEHPREFVLMSIRQMAQRLKTDPATVLRIARGLGFNSYPQFKAYLHELSIASATSLEGMQTSSPNESSLASHGRKALERDLHNLHSLRNTLDMNRVVNLAERIYTAKRIVLLGGDMAIGLVDFLDYKLTLLGLPVIPATTPGKTIHVTRTLGKHDLVIALSFRRCLRQTVEGVQQARASGAYTVGITDTFVLSDFGRGPVQQFLLCSHQLYPRALHDLRALPARADAGAAEEGGPGTANWIPLVFGIDFAAFS